MLVEAVLLKVYPNLAGTYLLHSALGALVPYIVGTWQVKVRDYMRSGLAVPDKDHYDVNLILGPSVAVNCHAAKIRGWWALDTRSTHKSMTKAGKLLRTWICLYRRRNKTPTLAFACHDGKTVDCWGRA